MDLNVCSQKKANKLNHSLTCFHGIMQITLWSIIAHLIVFQVLTTDIPYLTHEGQLWGVVCEFKVWFDALVQDCSNSSALAMELLQSCTKPSICVLLLHLSCMHYFISLQITQAYSFKNDCSFNRKNYCSNARRYHHCPQTLAEIYRNMSIWCSFRAVATREKYLGFILFSVSFYGILHQTQIQNRPPNKPIQIVQVYVSYNVSYTKEKNDKTLDEKMERNY